MPRLILIIVAAAVAIAPTVAALPQAVVITTDYVAAGSVGLLDLDAPWIVDADLVATHADAMGRWHDGLVYIVNRDGADNILVLDPAADLAVVRQFSLGLGRNLQDIAFLTDGTAFVSCYDAAELLHIDPTSGAILHVISTAGFADGDGLPETGRMRLVGDRLFVTCERLDRDGWPVPVGDSYLLVLDTADRTWVDCDAQLPGVQGILLAAANPSTDIVPDGGHLLVGCTGFYAVSDGGVDVVDPDALVSLGLEVTETDLGGDVVGLTGGRDGRRHVVVSTTSFHTRVKVYAAGGSVQTLLTAGGYYHAAVAYDGDFQVFVADRTEGAAGVRVLDAASGAQLTSGPVGTGLPPGSFVLPAQPPVSVAELPVAQLTLAAPWPNPANPRTTVAVAAPAGAVVDLRLLDLRGRLVRRHRLVIGAEGSGRWTFDGRDRRGMPVASGVYRCVVEGGGGFAARSLTIVR